MKDQVLSILAELRALSTQPPGTEREGAVNIVLEKLAAVVTPQLNRVHMGIRQFAYDGPLGDIVISIKGTTFAINADLK